MLCPVNVALISAVRSIWSGVEKKWQEDLRNSRRRWLFGFEAVAEHWESLALVPELNIDFCILLADDGIIKIK